MNLLDRLLGHDAWTTRQFLLICLDLSDEQLDRDFDIGHRSVRATLEHMIRNMEIWSDLMSGNLDFRPPVLPPPTQRPAQDSSQVSRPGTRDASPQSTRPGIDMLIERLDAAATLLAEVTRHVAERDGWDEFWIDPLESPPVEITYGGGIAHVITHSMHHRAHLLYMFRQLGVTDLPEGDVLSWESQARSQ